MELAASNLLSNAAQHAASQFRLRLARHGSGFEMSVDDDGNGVPEAARDTVFKAFTRLDDSRSRQTGGYGLGLAIVARIAALHGGAPSVGTSADLGGASFSVRWLPPGAG
jgi:two-component system sensor kinase ParS